MRVYDCMGSVVYEIKGNMESRSGINVNSFPAGMYYVRVMNYGRSLWGRFIKF